MAYEGGKPADHPGIGDVGRPERVRAGLDVVDRTTRVAYTFMAPSGYGSVRVDIGRSWNVYGDYRRNVSTPQGATPEPFVTGAAVVSAFVWAAAMGRMGRRLDLAADAKGGG